MGSCPPSTTRAGLLPPSCASCRVPLKARSGDTRQRAASGFLGSDMGPPSSSVRLARSVSERGRSASFLATQHGQQVLRQNDVPVGLPLRGQVQAQAGTVAAFGSPLILSALLPLLESYRKVPDLSEAGGGFGDLQLAFRWDFTTAGWPLAVDSARCSSAVRRPSG